MLPKYYDEFTCKNNHIEFENTESGEIETLTLVQIKKRIG